MTNLVRKIKYLLFTLFCIFSLLGVPFIADASVDEALFAGGCFWCLEHDLEDLPGVISVESGYSGGELINPSYSNHNGHQETVLVKFDSSKITYPKLLNQFWINIDPFDGEGQFCDRGDSYKPVIFTSGSDQRELAQKSFEDNSRKLNSPAEKLKVEIKDYKKFWRAEKYHQDFAIKNPIKYSFYRYSCGRDKRLDSVWGEQRSQ